MIQAASYLSPTTVEGSLKHDNTSPFSESPGLAVDLENASTKVEPHKEPISIWTWKTVGIAFNGFFLAFLNAITNGITYGFLLGYMGLDSYVMSSITALMKLPQVLVLPFGLITDCFPICGMNRKLAMACQCGGFLKLGVHALRVPIMRTIVFWGLHLVPLIFGNCHVVSSV